jgi:sulfatase-like protein
MPRMKFLYPFLFAIIPILHVASRNPGYATGKDIATSLAFAVLGCAVVYAITAGVLRRAAPVTALLVFLLVLAFYAVVPLAEAAVNAVGRFGGLALLVILGGTAAALFWRQARRPGSLERLSSFLALSGLFLVVWLSGRIVRDQLRARSAIAHSALVRALAQPVEVKPGKRPAPPPDIYLIVLDEYANSNVLREQFKFDNRAFLDSLTRLGFTIPKRVHSNYAHTILSLPSLLNFSHLAGLAAELGRSTTDPTLPGYLLQHNRAVTFLKRQGYRILFYPSQWWPATEHSPQADAEFEAWHGMSLGRELTRSHFRRTLTQMTPLGQIFREPPYDTDHVRRTLEALQSVPAHPEPTFAFAHVMNPHYPYVFEADCRPVPPHGAKRKRVAYVNQLQCLNRLVLATVTTLLQRSASPPVILLQGDHGTSTLNFSWAPSAAAVSQAQARERFGAFGAYYLPNGGSHLVSDSVTIVNVLQRVLSYYLGADAPPSEDRLYMSIERKPYDFVAVDPTRLGDPVLH